MTQGASAQHIRPLLQSCNTAVRGFGRLGASNWEMAVVFGCCTKTIERARQQTASGLSERSVRDYDPPCEPSSGLSIIKRPDFVCKGCRGGRSDVIFAGSHLLFPKMSQGEYSSLRE